MPWITKKICIILIDIAHTLLHVVHGVIKRCNFREVEQTRMRFKYSNGAVMSCFSVSSWAYYTRDRLKIKHLICLGGGRWRPAEHVGLKYTSTHLGHLLLLLQSQGIFPTVLSFHVNWCLTACAHHESVLAYYQSKGRLEEAHALGLCSNQ